MSHRMFRILAASFGALLVCGQSYAQPVQKAAIDLNWGVGENTSVVVGDQRMRPVMNKLQGLLGHNAYELAVSWLKTGVTGPVNSINRVYYIQACMPHSCGTDNIVIGVSEDTGDVYAMMSHSGPAPNYQDFTNVYGSPPFMVMQTFKNHGR